MKNKDNFIDYIISNSDDRTAYYIDMIRYHLGGKVYHYGDQFKYAKNKGKKRPIKLLYILEFIILKVIKIIKFKSIK